MTQQTEENKVALSQVQAGMLVWHEKLGRWVEVSGVRKTTSYMMTAEGKKSVYRIDTVIVGVFVCVVEGETVSCK